ncbi:sugar ABC transporter permease [Streptomyces sp. NPDC004647]|uniref:sugar ABC transporter permease n=1 Tax=Streptomyces sp. NPDC004647 TaxID=3154671 RepID=UPI0033AEB8EA
MSTPLWAEQALATVLERVVATRAEVGGRFPLFAEPDSGRWTTTSRGSWTGGFWAGLLWLRALHTGEKADRDAATQCTGRLADWTEADTATRGLILWYGTALAAGPGGEDQAARLRDRAARSCLDAVEPGLGLVPWGSAFGGPRLLARADGVPGMVPLLAGAGPDGVAAAGSHLRRHLQLCLGEGALRPAWRFDAAAGWSACDIPPPGWSRGRAWLLLAAADALHHLGPGEFAGRARYLAAPGPVPVPLADEARPDGPLDTSAAAITAVALLKLARATDESWWYERAVTTLENLVRAHVTGPGAHRPPGMLLHGCYDLDLGTATQHELVWGNFFLAYGLAVLTGLIDVWDA